MRAIASPAAGGPVAGDPAVGNVQGTAGGVQAATASRSAGTGPGVEVGAVVPAAAAAGLGVGDRGPRNGRRAGGGIEPPPARVVTRRCQNRYVAPPRHVIREGYVVERDIAAVVEYAAAQRIGGPGQGAIRAVILGQA